jgi:hypothetical protein
MLKYRPITTITLYHSSDGVWRIPKFFLDNVSDYSFHMRLHSWAGTGAVFYTIPKERGFSNNKVKKVHEK